MIQGRVDRKEGGGNGEWGNGVGEMGRGQQGGKDRDGETWRGRS